MFLVHLSAEQAPLLAAAVAGACRIGNRWSTAFQPRFLALIFQELLGETLDFEQLEAIDVEAAAGLFPQPQQRRELVELLVLAEMLVNPVPPELERSIERWAARLGVDDRSLVMARDVAFNSRSQAQSDFYRLFWMGVEDRQTAGFEQLLELHGPKAWTFTFEPDAALAARWRALATAPPGSLGAAVWRHYQTNRFTTPGELGGANAALAHHDWLHVLGDYQVDVVGEVENAAFGAASSSVPGANLWFLGVMAMYEGGLFDSVVAGGQQNCVSAPGVPERVVAALKRGRQCSRDLLAIDYFTVADQPLKELQEAWGIAPRC
ncbi:hypothetical protein KQ313_12085 [Synechococcus sp. CS-1325]|uniref:hypothetical protein n=1 Tax=Synechococcus sp. CS-1325 TaxID=2847979 RepID=UPI000DB19DAC|nr:hypothetical protein [Synechococcus sp. CS-1325]MCT0200414.1 hypothetical protein [Synechococcus sp. CS-1325]PZU98166.1 MAG: hypothetical protein DCF24_11340 [Cyanobium sp.]